MNKQNKKKLSSLIKMLKTANDSQIETIFNAIYETALKKREEELEK